MPNTQPTVTRWNRRIQRLIRRDGLRCWVCGIKVILLATHRNSLAPSVDHVLERRNHGWDGSDNYRLAHRWCNAARAQIENVREHPRWIQIMHTARISARPEDDPVAYAVAMDYLERERPGRFFSQEHAAWTARNASAS